MGSSSTGVARRRAPSADRRLQCTTAVSRRPLRSRRRARLPLEQPAAASARHSPRRSDWVEATGPDKPSRCRLPGRRSASAPRPFTVDSQAHRHLPGWAPEIILMSVLLPHPFSAHEMVGTAALDREAHPLQGRTRQSASPGRELPGKASYRSAPLRRTSSSRQ